MIRIRTATEDDLPRLLEIYNDIIINTTAVYDYEPHTIEMRKQWWETKKTQGFPVFVAEDEGRIVGFSSIGPFRAWAAYKYSVENSVYVTSDARGKGIGKLLIPPLLDASKKLGIHTVIIWCRKKEINDIYLGTIDILVAAQQFYMKNGFVEVEKKSLPINFPVMRVDNRFFKLWIGENDNTKSAYHDPHSNRYRR